jgi:hypothetical protein
MIITTTLLQMPKLPTNNTDSISQALDLTPINNTPRVEDNSAINDDYNFARANLINTIMKGNEALDGMLDVASMSQHPRGYEVVATIINSLTNANKDLLELSKKKKDLTGEKAPTTINNNLFVGSTAELQKLMNKKDAE